MTQREGNLEAPTRHAIDWQSASYYDEATGNISGARPFLFGFPRGLPVTTSHSRTT